MSGDVHEREDLGRYRYLRAVLDGMKSSPEEERRVRRIGLDLIDLKRRKGYAGPSHIARWERLLALPLEHLEAELMAMDETGRELRHAHMLPGAIPAREANALLAPCQPDVPS